MSFKEVLQDDLDIFINDDEFADTCIFVMPDGQSRQVKAVIDSSIADNFEGAQIRGLFTSTIVAYIKQGTLQPLPAINSVIRLNGLPYFCRDVSVEQGLDVLTLERKTS